MKSYTPVGYLQTADYGYLPFAISIAENPSRDFVYFYYRSLETALYTNDFNWCRKVINAFCGPIHPAIVTPVHISLSIRRVHTSDFRDFSVQIRTEEIKRIGNIFEDVVINHKPDERIITL